MKILQINAVNSIGSTGRNASELSEYLIQNGQESIIAYSKGPLVNVESEYKIGSNFDTKLHGLLSRITGKQGYFSKSATKKLLNFMDDYRPNVVVLNNLHGNYINFPMLLRHLAEKDIPTIAVLHDCWFYTGKCCHYTAQGCYKWHEFCGNCPQLKKYNKSWFFDRTKKLHKDKITLFGDISRLAVVGVSNWILEESKKSPVFKNAMLFKRIYNWIDTEIFFQKRTEEIREKLGLKEKKIILSVASGWNNEKGINTIFGISKNLKEDEKYILIGNTGNIIVPESVIHIPTTNSVEELSLYYSLADVFVQPSTEETFGKVCAEALACGTPIVCFNSTANPELVGNGCGEVVSVGDICGCIRAIRDIIKNGKPKYADNCRNFAISNFKKESNLEEYLKTMIEISQI